MALNLLNLYSLIFALFSKIDGMSKELVSLQPTLNINASTMSETMLNVNETLTKNLPPTCIEVHVPCIPCDIDNQPLINQNKTESVQGRYLDNNSYEIKEPSVSSKLKRHSNYKLQRSNNYKQQPLNRLKAENLQKDNSYEKSLLEKEIERIRKISGLNSSESSEATSEEDDNYIYDSINFDFISSTDVDKMSESLYDDSSTTNPSPFNFFYYSTNPSTDTDSDLTNTISKMYESSTTVTDTTMPEHNNLDTAYTNLKSEYISTTEQSETSSFMNGGDQTTIFDLRTEDTSTNPDLTVTPRIKSPTDFLENEYISNKTTFYQNIKMCPNISINCSIKCGEKKITQIIYLSNYTIVDIKCYRKECNVSHTDRYKMSEYKTHITAVDTAYYEPPPRPLYNLTKATRKKLLKLCWETMFGQELVKLTVMDLVFVVLGTLFMDFFRALFVRYMNKCWCWDLEKKFPEYGDFKIAENILHLINNQGLVWMGMFFSPGLVVLNVVKLMIMMYLRSWAVMTCNVPHEVVFRVSKSNNFYLGLLLTMLFLCVLPVGYTIVWVKPSWHCGPFSEYDKIYKILTRNIYKVLPNSLNFTLEYIASPAIVIPLLVLLILIIYYLISLTNSLREANNDLKIQLRRERTEERRKMFQLVDTRRRTGSSSIDNTPLARWKKALPSFAFGKSIDSDDRKAVCSDEVKESKKSSKKGGGIFAKIVGLAVDKSDKEISISCPNQNDNDADAAFHEILPEEILQMKDISVIKNSDTKKKNNVEFNTSENFKIIPKKEEKSKPNHKSTEHSITRENTIDQTETVDKKCIREFKVSKNTADIESELNNTATNEKNPKQLDPIGAVIPVITISTTESDDEILQCSKTKEKKLQRTEKHKTEINLSDETLKKHEKKKRSLKKVEKCADFRSLRRQNSVESVHEKKDPKDKKLLDCGHKYQYSL